MDAIGHNTEAGGHLRSFVDRLETIDDARLAEVEAFKDVLAEAKSEGFDPKIIRKIVALRRQDEAKRKETQQLLDTYLHALGFDLF